MKITSKHNRSSRNITFQTILLFHQKKLLQLRTVVFERVGMDCRQEKKCTIRKEAREISHLHNLHNLHMISIQHQMMIHLVLRSLQ